MRGAQSIQAWPKVGSGRRVAALHADQSLRVLDSYMRGDRMGWGPDSGRSRLDLHPDDTISWSPPVSLAPCLGCGAVVGFRERSQSRVWHIVNVFDVNKCL